jgi:hypothetical protein
MLTRSAAKDCMARAVFEQPPPVLDVILRNIQYENENDNEVLTHMGYRFFWCSRPLSLWWMSIEVCRRRFKATAVSQTHFLSHKSTEVA